MKTSTQITLKWGLISGIVYFISTFIQQYAGLMDELIEANSWIAILIGTILNVTFIFLTLKEFREENEGFISYKKGLGVSTLLGGISGVVTGIFNYVYLSFIDTNFVEKQMDKVRDQWEQQGLTASQIESAEGITKIFMGPGAQFVMIILFSIIFHVLLGLIVAAIVKREKPIFD
ncbi:MAG: hypothetical protein RIR51_1610 [Bacteroidota bacterium]